MQSLSRRSFVRSLSAVGVATCASTPIEGQANALPKAVNAAEDIGNLTRHERMRWWHQAKFGMFIHWGLYSMIGRQEWVMEVEGLPIPEYEQLAKHFQPRPNVAREWAKLARRAGQKYMVMTAKHHEGFCMFDTRLTDYCSTKQGPRRDLVLEFVQAARAEGLRVGLYYSLMDWHHPDGARCATDEVARRRFVDYTHGLLRELMTNYGKIDILWYDVDEPLTPAQWESERMNRMVFELQPDIIVNNRNGLAGDFSTPEQTIEAAKGDRAWEANMTLNGSWGYQKADDSWKSPKTVLNNLAFCASGGGNYLLNIGPMGDGSIPQPTVEILEAVGRWMQHNGEAVYGAERGEFVSWTYANYTRRGSTLFIHVYFWPGETPAEEWMALYQPATVLSIGGFKGKAVAAKVLKTGQPIAFTQDEFHLRLTGLPLTAPDEPITVLVVECEHTPSVVHADIRSLWPRYNVDMSTTKNSTKPALSEGNA